MLNGYSWWQSLLNAALTGAAAYAMIRLARRGDRNEKEIAEIGKE